MIIITGAAGFIGSCLAKSLADRGFHNLLLVDDFSRGDKTGNLLALGEFQRVNREDFLQQIKSSGPDADFVFHIGARTDTAEMRHEVFDHLNTAYSKAVWEWCAKKSIPLIYASSAATYGNGEHGYIDRHDLVPLLKPLNPYGESKQQFDCWALEQRNSPPFWAGLKFFNVFGPNEYHKGRMASVIFHAHQQILTNGSLKLFRSHRPDFSDGGQMRDFIYVKDLLDVMIFMMQNKPGSGLYNLGTGKARSFRDLGNAVFAAMGKNPVIEYIDTPEDIRDKYQYYTQAEMSKLRQAGYAHSFTELEEAVNDYVNAYLSTSAQF
jgi:ADP-L-glycero-D-manno-heptose 6-epimerase